MMPARNVPADKQKFTELERTRTRSMLRTLLVLVALAASRAQQHAQQHLTGKVISCNA
jgi:hypothetical protein